MQSAHCSTRRLSVLVLTLCSVAGSGGCDLEPETLDSLRQAVNQVSKQNAGDGLPRQRPTDAARSDAFQPLYPDRVDPFTFPDDAPVADGTDTSMPSVAQVRVLGFAHVDQPRVFLRTKEVTRSLKVGDRADGVEVIAIKPPAVELRLGNLVWTATMFDKTILQP